MRLNRLRRKQDEEADPMEAASGDTGVERPRKLASLGGFALIAIGAAAAYVVWPSGIGDVPLASLTLGMLARAFCSIAIAFFSFLFAGALWH